jgi:Protein of unknown function (DUF742)
MIRKAIEDEDPDRLYTVTRGRSRAGSARLDLVTLVVSVAEPKPGTQSEYARILRICHYPTAVVELSAELGLPVSVVKILVSDLLAEGQISLRHPSSGRASTPLPDAAFLKKVLVGLHNL